MNTILHNSMYPVAQNYLKLLNCPSHLLYWKWFCFIIIMYASSCNISIKSETILIYFVSNNVSHIGWLCPCIQNYIILRQCLSSVCDLTSNGCWHQWYVMRIIYNYIQMFTSYTFRTVMYKPRANWSTYQIVEIQNNDEWLRQSEMWRDQFTSKRWDNHRCGEISPHPQMSQS